MKKLFFLVLCLCLLVGICGCFDNAPSNLTVYTYSSFPTVLIEKIKVEFLEKFGASVDVQQFSDSGPMFNSLLREKNHPKADVVIGLDNSFYFKAQEHELLESYQPENIKFIDKQLLFDDEYRLIPYDYGFVVFNYDSERLTNVPQSYDDLLLPEFRKKIVISNPLTSSPGQIFLLTTIAVYGEDGYLDYWRKLKQNLLAIAPGWDEAYGIYTSGEAPIVLSYGTSPVYHYLYDKTERYQPLVFNDSAYFQIEGAGILKGTKNRKLAERFINYLISADFQSTIPEAQMMYPVNSKVELPDSFKIAGKAKKTLNLPNEKVRANLNKWLSDWENAINE